MSGPTVSSRARKGRLSRLAPGVAVLLVALLAGLSLGVSFLVARHFRGEAQSTSQLYSVVFRGLNDPDPNGGTAALSSQP